MIVGILTVIGGVVVILIHAEGKWLDTTVTYTHTHTHTHTQHCCITIDVFSVCVMAGVEQ